MRQADDALDEQLGQYKNTIYLALGALARPGKKHGRWVEHLTPSMGSEGPYVDGKKHGHWVESLGGGFVREGP